MATKLAPAGFDRKKLKPHPRNPRSINRQQEVDLSNWMAEYGDIGGITINKRTNNHVAGNQRGKRINMQTAPITWWQVNEEPDEVGTVAMGVVYLEEDGKQPVPFFLRWVDWPEDKEERALLIANKAGGAWDWGIIKEGFGQQLLLNTGFTRPELELHGVAGKLGEKHKAKIGKGEEKPRNLVEHYVAPPFSVLDSRQGYWQTRKKQWLELIKKAGGGADANATRKGTMAGPGESYVSTINEGAAILDPVLAECMLLWFGQPGGRVFDPFAGRVFGFLAAAKGMDFIGMELREEQAQLSQATVEAADLPGSARYVCDDGQNLLKYMEPGTQDLLVTDPPYLWLEKYSSDPRDLSNMSEEQFYEVYERILHEAYLALKNERFAVVVVGEVRRKKGGAYANLVGTTIGIMLEAGFEYYNELVVIKPAGTLPYRAHAFMQAGRKVGKQHQNVLVFYKGDTSKIGDNFGAIDAKLLGEKS